MPRTIPFVHRRLGEEAVRRGLVAAVVMEAAAREWAGLEGEEPFPEYLVRRAVLPRERVEELAAAVAGEAEAGAPGEPAPAEGGAAPHPSEVVKGYRILERLGRGGMGSVYRAEQAGMNRTVALKILRRPFGEQEEHVERLRREARLVGSLDHPNIVRGLDVGQHGPYHYFAMEFVEGETLREILRKRGPLPEAEALRIVGEVCHALDHAHSRGVVHRDVKPGNIIVTPEGTAKLTDYGLAKGPADFTLTQSGVTIGTPQYISPEQAREPAGVDIQTDIYSLGATAYHMLAGIPPHASETLAGLLTKVLYEKPRTARQVNPRVSAEASFLVEKMMAKNRRHRYREPREVLRDLRALAAGKSIVPRDWAGDFEVHELRRRTRRIVAGSVAAVVLLAAGAVVLQVDQKRQTLRARREVAQLALNAILEKENPRSRQGWEALREELDEFLRRDENRDTPARLTAEREYAEVQKRIDQWTKAEAIRLQAQEREQARKFREAAAAIERELGGFDGTHYGRDPASWLREQRKAILSAGFQAAEEVSRKALEDAGKVPAREGAARQVQEGLEAARDDILRDLVDLGDAAPVAALDAVLKDLRDARAEIDDACLGESYVSLRDRMLGERDFRAVEEELARVAERIDGDVKLQDLLRRLPAPAAEDLRRRTEGEYRRVKAMNEQALLQAAAEALAWEQQGDPDRAIDWLRQAEEHSAAELREPVARLRQEIAARRDAAAQAAEARVRELLSGVLDDLARRDYRGAAGRIDAAAPAVANPSGGPGLAAALSSARFLLDRIEDQAFLPVRRRIAEGAEFPRGLRFEEGTRQPHPQVANVRLKETDTGPVVVFDAPPLRDLEGSLHRMTLDLLLGYAGLSGGGLTLPQALARSALVVSEGASASVARRDLEDAQSELRQMRDRLPPSAIVVDALVARAGTLVAAKVMAEEDLEKEAERTLDLALQAYQRDDPITAIHHYDFLLTGPLGGTRFARVRKGYVAELRVKATEKVQELDLRALFLGARVTEPPARPGEPESLTRVEWSFDEEEQAKGFLRPEDGGDPLYRIVFDDPDNGAARNGRMRILAGAGGRGPADSPLTLPCPFKPSRYIGVSFTLRMEEPFFLQVSVVGNHVGVLTDDGRRTSGRGVHAWQSDDWRDPDRFFPPEYRHDHVAARYPDPLRVKDKQGQRYFQFEAGATYSVRVEWDRGHLRLHVDNREVWHAELSDKLQRDDPPRIRITSFTPAWIDDLAVEGVVDRPELNKLLPRR